MKCDCITKPTRMQWHSTASPQGSWDTWEQVCVQFICPSQTESKMGHFGPTGMFFSNKVHCWIWSHINNRTSGHAVSLNHRKKGLTENRKHYSVGLTWPNSESCSRAKDRFKRTSSRSHTAFPLSTKTFPITCESWASTDQLDSADYR